MSSSFSLPGLSLESRGITLLARDSRLRILVQDKKIALTAVSDCRVVLNGQVPTYYYKQLATAFLRPLGIAISNELKVMDAL